MGAYSLCSLLRCNMGGTSLAESQAESEAPRSIRAPEGGPQCLFQPTFSKFSKNFCEILSAEAVLLRIVSIGALFSRKLDCFSLFRLYSAQSFHLAVVRAFSPHMMV